MNFQRISYNFSIAKIGAILMVVTGHYFPNTILWIPTTIALFIFAFSSGFFTATKYSGNFSILQFWNAKIRRLGLSLCVINMFLFSVFLYQNKPGLWSWHTIPCLLGLNGFLTWVRIPNESSFGAGLWFFTLLILFYLTYPILDRINIRVRAATLFLLLSTGLLSALHFYIPMGHSLWVTTLAFIFGVYSARNRITIPPLVSLGCILVTSTVMLVLNIEWKINLYNYFLILILAWATVHFLLEYQLPEWLLGKVSFLSNCLLEIYFIHTYLFIHADNLPWIASYTLSVMLIIVIALLLNQSSNQLSRLVLSHLEKR